MNHGGGSLLQGKPILYGTVAGSIGEGVGQGGRGQHHVIVRGWDRVGGDSM